MAEDLTLFWGDTHHNSYQHYVQDPPLMELLGFCSSYLDFYTGAYYTPAYTKAPALPEAMREVAGLEGGHLSEALPESGVGWTGVNLEDLKDPDAMAREWTEFQEATTHWNRPGRFVAFPGYEWQGNGRWGDLNVTYREEGHPIVTVPTVRELYARLRNMPAIAVPHHTGYYVGQRAPHWEACDDSVSPYAELYSIHGCSETDEEWIGLRSNAHMGPGTAGGTYQRALDLGLHLGAICSTDNWTNMPGYWGHGLMGCYASELTRESLWEAFLARRVYGVTGDRIRLEFACNGFPMGSILQHADRREFSVSVRGADAIDRIELLKNGRAIATACHQDAWSQPEPARQTRFKMRIEPGWGPRLGEIPRGNQVWQGELELSEGRFVGWEPCWVNRGNTAPVLEGQHARFSMVSLQAYVDRQAQGATLFEFETRPGAQLTVRLNGLEESGPVAEFAAGSRIMWFRDDCIKLVRETTGVVPDTARRGDVYYQMANKAKIHKAIPEAGFQATLEAVDSEPLESEANYRVCVEQRNGQRAWSSPIWVKG